MSDVFQDRNRYNVITSILIPALWVVLLSLALSRWASAEVYRVGPKEKHARVSEIASGLQPGDIVEVTGDLEDHFAIDKSGTSAQPITIRGITRVENGKLLRPRLKLDNIDTFAIVFNGDWIVLEGLDITGAKGPSYVTGTAVYVNADHLVVRNCFIHHNFQGILSEGNRTGSVLVEFCEFDSNGAQVKYHSADFSSTKPGDTAIVQFCYFHDATNGVFLKLHCPRNVIRYNWFENQYYAAIGIVNQLAPPEAQEATLDSPLYPMHSDIVGNVFVQGWSPGSRYSILSLGGEDVTAPGTEGEFNIAHNLFITTRGGVSPAVPILLHGNVDRLKVFNNVFLELGVKGCQLYLRGNVWDTPRTKQFTDRRGNGEPIVEGANNWASTRTTDIPETFLGTLRGVNPRFLDLLNSDYRPAKDSPLVGAGMFPLPKGEAIDLIPEYEPQRGVSVDLKAKARRKVTPPSIGPFEVAQ